MSTIPTDECKDSDKIRAFVIENFLYGEETGLTDDDSLLEEGIVDSTGILQLVTFLEREFSIVVGDEELVPENLDSLGQIKSYLQRKLADTDPEIHGEHTWQK